MTRFYIVLLSSIILSIYVTAVAFIGASIGRILFNSEDVNPIMIGQLDLGFIAIGIPILLFMWRPKNILPLILGLIASGLMVAISARWDTVTIGSRDQLSRLIHLQTGDTFELIGVSLIVILMGIATLTHSVLDKLAQDWTLQLYLPGWKNRIPLVIAAIRNDTTTLAQKGRTPIEFKQADPAYGRSALHWAVIKNHPEAVEALLTVNTDQLVSKDFNDNLPIHFASSQNPVILKMLIAAGSPVWITNKFGYVPLTYIFRDRHLESLKTFIDMVTSPIPKGLASSLRAELREINWPEGHALIEKSHLVSSGQS